MFSPLSFSSILSNLTIFSLLNNFCEKYDIITIIYLGGAILKAINKIKRFLKKNKWKLNNYILKKEHVITPIKIKVSNAFKILCFVIVYLCCLKMLNVIVFDFNSIVFIKFKNIEYNNIFGDLIIAQIGSTFLTTAILSLVSSIEDKHILGEKTTKLLYGKSLIKFYLPMIILYISMIINVVLIINKQHFNVMISMFLLSVFTLICIINKIGSIFVTTKKYVSVLYAKYYKECEYNIINKIPPKDYESELLSNLKEETIRLIANNDNSYIKYINMYKTIIDRLLFNIPKELQKYHLDMIYAPSIINDFIEIIEHFIYFKDETRAIQCYSWLLNRFDFHNLYIPFNKMNNLLESLSNKILDFNNEYETTNYLEKISGIITGIEVQQHFALTNDYSHIKLHEDVKSYKYHYSGNYFELLYDKVHSNKYLTDLEKNNCYTRLYDIFRLSGHNGSRVFRDITNFSWDYKTPKKRTMPQCIIGQATTLLLIKTLLYKEERNFKLFIQINICPEEMRFAIHNLIIGLIHIEKYKENENLYSRFYGLDLDYCRRIINDNLELLYTHTDSWYNKETTEYLQQDYDYIYKVCNNDENKKDVLFLDPILKNDKQLINQYFDNLSKKYKKKIKINSDDKKDYKSYIKSYIK